MPVMPISPPSPKPLVLIFTSNEGHESIANAAAHILASDYTIKIHKERIMLEALYLNIYRYFPWFFSLPYSLSFVRPIYRLVEFYFYHRDQARLRSIVDSHQPAALVSTYFAFNPALRAIALEKNIPFLNCIANPVSTHPLEISPSPAINLTFDNLQSQRCLQLKPTCQTETIGWLVRPTFRPLADAPAKKILQKQLELETDLPTLLLVGGSEGSARIAQLATSILKLNLPIQVVVICGHNHQLYLQLRRLKQTITKTNIHLQILEFVTNVHQYMQASDLVIGKGGPNTIFEAVACHKPFMITTHVQGQEDGNLQLVKNLVIGYVAEQPDQAIQIIERVLHNPSELQKYDEPLIKLAEYNKQAETKLLRVMKKLNLNNKQPYTEHMKNKYTIHF